MNTQAFLPIVARIVAASTFAFSAAAALADDVTVAPEMDRATAVTTARADVRAGLLQAREARSLTPAGEAGTMEATAPATALSREQVRADLRKASSRTAGELYLPA